MIPDKMKSNNRTSILVFILLTAGSFFVDAQSCSTGVTSRNFFTFCSGGTSLTYNGDYAITIGNGATLTINGNVTINGTLTVTMVGASSVLRISSPNTLTATNLTFSGSATGKNVIVDGPDGAIVVDQTLNFGGMNIDLDGTGAISAGDITGAGNITCSSDGSCPAVEAASCNGDPNFCNNDVLPVELIAFTSSVDKERVSLNWITASQLNFSHFEVEHSLNAEAWLRIASIQGEGTTSELNEYAYEHSSPHNGKNYYRLRMVDLDETFEYSSIVAVVINSGRSFSVSPNPSNGKLVRYHLNFDPATGDAITIYDLTGVQLYTTPISTTSASILLPNSLQPGTYIVQYKGAVSVKPLRLMID